MCYTIYLSTTTEEDLSKLTSEVIRFEPILDWVPDPIPGEDDSLEGLMCHPHLWFLVSRYGGCSCHYRHLGKGSDMRFGPPEDWSPEDDEDVESTQAVYDVFARILREGHELDVLDVWANTPVDSVSTIEVRLSQVPRESFRFFDGTRFQFVS